MPPYRMLLVCTGNICRSAAGEVLLTEEHVNTADLILTATTEHRRFSLAVRPDAAARTFTLREASRLLAVATPVSGATVAERGHALVRLLGARADADWSAARQDDDIADPMGGGEAAHIRAVLEVDRALRDLVTALVGRSPE